MCACQLPAPSTSAWPSQICSMTAGLPHTQVLDKNRLVGRGAAGRRLPWPRRPPTPLAWLLCSRRAPVAGRTCTRHEASAAGQELRCWFAAPVVPSPQALRRQPWPTLTCSC